MGNVGYQQLIKTISVYNDKESFDDEVNNYIAQGYGIITVKIIEHTSDIGYFAVLARWNEIGEEEKQSVENDNWISLKDKMPNVGQEVMALCRGNIYTVLRYDRDTWYERSSKDEFIFSFVTHWQPLPKLPKEV